MSKFQINKKEYNEDEVHYCDDCLSLKIKTIDEKISYCCNCGGTDINHGNIFDWEKLYQNKYKKKFLNK